MYELNHDFENMAKSYDVISGFICETTQKELKILLTNFVHCLRCRVE